MNLDEFEKMYTAGSGLTFEQIHSLIPPHETTHSTANIDYFPNEAEILWRRWWDASDGNPWANDDRIADTCFFCDGSYEHHEDCVYLEVAKLLGKELVKCAWPSS